MPLDIDYNPCQGRVGIDDLYLTLMPSTPLNQWVQMFWQLNVPYGSYHYRSVPDNCVDLIINVAQPDEMFIVTPFTSSIVFEMTGPVTYFGIRFRLLGHHGLICAPVGEWNNPEHTVTPNDLLSPDVLHQLCESVTQKLEFQPRCEAVSGVILGAIQHRKIDSRIARYIRYCYQSPQSNINLSDKQCAQFGLSARQLRRLTHQYLGLTPKDFAKVLRFQTTLNLMNLEPASGVWANHYYDQSHFIREFKSMSGVTPSEFLSSSVLYNPN
ncbi:DUF6597 domain-containing transcriptional factor [Pseudomonas sp. HK3]